MKKKNLGNLFMQITERMNVVESLEVNEGVLKWKGYLSYESLNTCVADAA